MRLRVLGCYGAQLGDHRACGFLINESVLLDAGTIGRSLSLIEQSKIRYVLLTHIHMDHIKGLSSLSENRIPDNERNPVVIISLEDVLEGLERWVFNDQIWPKFTKIPTSGDPVFRMQPIKEGTSIEIEGLGIKAFSVNHVVPCAGFVVRQENASILFSGDTGETDQLWKAAAADPTLKAAFIEATFPNALEDLAIRSRHLTPRLLRQEFEKIGKPDLPVYAYHIKPRYLSAVKQELADLGIPNLRVLEDGSVLEFR